MLTLTTINLGISLALELVPEVVALANAIKGLFQKHPNLTPEQFTELVNQLAKDIHDANADTLKTLAGIDTTAKP